MKSAEVAASGGYLMACVADEIVAAPFAVLGSIGVITEQPNVYERLTREGISFETITAGKSPAGRESGRVEGWHARQFVAEKTDQVATGSSEELVNVRNRSCIAAVSPVIATVISRHNLYCILSEIPEKIINL